MQRVLYNDFSSWLKRRYGQKVYKIPVGLELNCPNRDGTCGIGGCSFCGSIGAGYEKKANMDFQIEQIAKSVQHQLHTRMEHIAIKHNAQIFIPYFLNFSNTYMNLDIFQKCMETSAGSFSDTKIVAIYIATRPDCISTEYLDILKVIQEKYHIDICIELGLQSVNYHTLEKINRGHGLGEFIDAVMQIKEYDFQICTHLILNLPYDDDSDAIEAAKLLSALRIDQVKLHSLFIVKGTPLAKEYEAGEFQIISCQEYIKRVITFLEYLSPDVVVQRIIGRAQKDNTLFSNWDKPFFVIRDEILQQMEKNGQYQGRYCDYLGGKAVKRFLDS